MALKDYDSRYKKGYIRERRSEHSNTYDGDNTQDRMSQQRHSRQGEYSDRDYRNDYSQDINYGERYGFSGYGRSHYDPDINRGWEESQEMNSWREGQPFNNREQDYRGGQWHRPTHSYQPKFGEPSYTRGGWNEGMDYGTRGEHNFGTHDGLRENSQDSTSYARQSTSRNRDRSYEGMRPSYSGIGPKNYRRSDDRIREDVCERLTEHPEINAANIEVTVSNCEVTLSGTTNDRYMKRAAEDIAETVQGVVDVNNQIHVADSTNSNGGRGSNNGGDRGSDSGGGRSSESSNGIGMYAENGSSSGKSKRARASQ